MSKPVKFLDEKIISLGVVEASPALLSNVPKKIFKISSQSPFDISMASIGYSNVFEKDDV